MSQPLFRVYEGGELARYEFLLPEVLPLQETAERLERASHIVGSFACGVSVDKEHEVTALRFVNYSQSNFTEGVLADIRRTAIGVSFALGGRTPQESKRKYRAKSQAIVNLGDECKGEKVTSEQLLEAVRVGRSVQSSQIEHGHLDFVSVSPGSIHTEPAVKFSFHTKLAATRIAQATAKLDRKRFFLEVPSFGRVFMVETPLCEEHAGYSFVRKSATGLPQYTIAPRQTEKQD